MIRSAKCVSKDIVNIYKLIKFGADNAQVLYRPKKEVEKSINSFWVWEIRGVIVACSALDIYSNKLAEIRSLVVAPTYQGKGIGTMLIKACKKEAKRQGIYEILAVTEKDSLFEKNGFKKCLNGQWPMFIKLKNLV